MNESQVIKQRGSEKGARWMGEGSEWEQNIKARRDGNGLMSPIALHANLKH